LLSAGDSSDSSGIWHRLRVAALLAAAALGALTPYLYYLTHVAFAAAARRRLPGLPAAELLSAEWIALALVIVTASLAGTFGAERYGLRGVGDGASLPEAKWLILLAAPLLSLGSYWLLGRHLAERVPGYYPAGLGWALAHVLKGALFDEVVARYGMMTICLGALASRAAGDRAGAAPRLTWKVWLANLIQAAFFTALALGGLSFYGLAPSRTFFFVASLVASLAIHLSLGYVYARYGLVAAMAFHLVLGLKYLVHVLRGGL
jgi:hypothetical protein